MSCYHMYHRLPLTRARFSGFFLVNFVYNLFSFRVEYGSDAMNYGGGDSDDSAESGTEAEDPDVKILQEKLSKERAEREAWLRAQRVRSAVY